MLTSCTISDLLFTLHPSCDQRLINVVFKSNVNRCDARFNLFQNVHFKTEVVAFSFCFAYHDERGGRSSDRGSIQGRITTIFRLQKRKHYHVRPFQANSLKWQPLPHMISCAEISCAPKGNVMI